MNLGPTYSSGRNQVEAVYIGTLRRRTPKSAQTSAPTSKPKTALDTAPVAIQSHPPAQVVTDDGSLAALESAVADGLAVSDDEKTAELVMEDVVEVEAEDRVVVTGCSVVRVTFVVCPLVSVLVNVGVADARLVRVPGFTDPLVLAVAATTVTSVVMDIVYGA